MNTRSKLLVVLATAWLCGCDADEIMHEESTGGSGGQALPDDDFPTRMAEGYCAVLFGCDPNASCQEATRPYTTEADCVAFETAELEEVRAAGRGAGLTYDAECVDSTIARYSEIGCDSFGTLERRNIDPLGTCPPYYGTIPEGENPCFEVVGSALSDCGQGLVCSDEICGPGFEPPCPCAEGMACNNAASTDEDRCVPVVGEGEPCSGELGEKIADCGPMAYCNADWTEDGMLTTNECVSTLANGEACDGDYQCGSSFCDGTCQPLNPWLCHELAAPSSWR